jgi:hypothetical protein
LVLRGIFDLIQYGNDGMKKERASCHKRIYNNQVLFLWAALFFAILITLTYTVTRTPYAANNFVKVTITALNEQNPFSHVSKVTICGAKVDGVFYSAESLFSNGWVAPGNGDIYWTSWESETSKVNATIPAGKEQSLLLRTDAWSGFADVTWFDNRNDHSIKVDLQTVYGGITSLRLNRNNVIRFDFQTLIVFLIGITGIYTFYLITQFLFFKDVHIICVIVGWGLKKTIFLLLCWMTLSALLTSGTLYFPESPVMPLWFLPVSVAGAFPFYLYYLVRRFIPCKIVKKSFDWIYILVFAMLIPLTYFVAKNKWSALYNAQIWSETSILRVLFSSMILVISLSALSLFVLESVNWLRNFVRNTYGNLDRAEKIYCAIFGTFIVTVLIFAYTNSSALSYSFVDEVSQRRYAKTVYAYDHSWILDSYSTISGLNVRHPLHGMLQLLLGSIAKIISVPISHIFTLAYPFFLALIMSFMMMSSAIMLKRITKSTWAMLFLSNSYFFVILCLGAINYQLSIFFTMATLHSFISKKKSPDTVEGILMSGTCLTSGFLVPFIVPFENLNEYLRSILRYCVLFLGIMLVAGVASSLNQLPMFIMLHSGINPTGMERLYHLTHFFKWCFVEPNSAVVWGYINEPGAVYTGIEPTSISWIGCAVLCLCVISAVVNRKLTLVKISAVTVLFFSTLCGILNWAWGTEWVYAVFATWAPIVLIEQLLIRIFNGKIFKICMLALFCVMCIVNIYSLTEFLRFCVQYYNVLSQ